MSLLSIASPWNNDDISPKKRVSTMRKTIKKQPLPESINSSVREMNDNFQPYISREYIFDEPADEAEPESISKYKKDEESRQKRVTELLNNVTQVDADNSGQRLADFKPLSHPIIQKRTDDAETTGRSADEPMSNGYNPLQIPPPIIPQRPSDTAVSTNRHDLGVSNNPYTTNPYSNYNVSYNTSPHLTPLINGQRYQNQVLQNVDDKLMEKINYMIHLLEQQQNEKTSNITEEFVLYTFLGVFIIFIVDSFARSGKYRR